VSVSRPKRIYASRIISDHIMVQEDFDRLHKFLLETENLSEVSDGLAQQAPPQKRANLSATSAKDGLNSGHF